MFRYIPKMPSLGLFGLVSNLASIVTFLSGGTGETHLRKGQFGGASTRGCWQLVYGYNIK